VSELGKTLLRHARQLLSEAEDMAVDLGRSREEADRRVVFACQRPLSELVSPLLAGFARRQPEVALMTRVGRQEEVIEQVEIGAAGLGLCLSNRAPDGLKSIVVGRQELAVVASPDHPLARRRSVAPADLNGQDFVGAPEGSLFGQEVDRMLAEIGIDRVRLVSKATEFEVLRQLVIANVGLYCCLLHRIAPDLDRGIVVRLPLAAPKLLMSVRLLFPAGGARSASARLFGEFLQDALARGGLS
jgi:DNA-binding transcriptional LysR family regulator